MIYCALGHVERQLPNTPRIRRALEWLHREVAGDGDALKLLSSLEVGSSQRFEIEGTEIFANLMCYQTSPVREKLESHRVYYDIQYVHHGTEGLAWADTEKLEVLQPYDPEKDVAFYAFNGPVIELPLRSGNVVFLAPSDGHALGFTVEPQGSPERIEKVVLKVAL